MTSRPSFCGKRRFGPRGELSKPVRGEKTLVVVSTTKYVTMLSYVEA